MDIGHRVKRLIMIELDLDSLPENDNLLRADFGADSLDEVEIVMMIETEFDISINDDKLCTFDTVADLVEEVERLVSC